MTSIIDVSVRSNSSTSSAPAVRYSVALGLVISLFFVWGLTYGLLDVLNKHFQQTLSVSRMQSALLQACYFGAYFLVAVPSGIYVNRHGYKRGLLLGLVLFAVGALLFVPATALGRLDHSCLHCSYSLRVRHALRPQRIRTLRCWAAQTVVQPG
jgi:FHS family L-fucose permease-like MFS transporter